MSFWPALAGLLGLAWLPVFSLPRGSGVGDLQENVLDNFFLFPFLYFKCEGGGLGKGWEVGGSTILHT